MECGMDDMDTPKVESRTAEPTVELGAVLIGRAVSDD